MDEAQLIKQAQFGDQEALVTLLQRRNQKLYRIAYMYVHNQADALDVVQETALQALLSIKRLRQPQYFDTWLVRIAIRCAYKQMASAPVPLSTASPSIAPTTMSDLRFDLQRDLAQLPVKLQEVVVLYYFEDQSLQTIAKGLHLPLGTVKSRLSRALTRLRQKGVVVDAYRLDR